MNIAFTNPAALYALALIIIPIIIHLFSFRKYKTVYFHSIHLLQNSQQDQNRTKTKLKEILILASRILAIIFMVLAFAQPHIPKADSSATLSQNVLIYIDNSFSMQGETEEGIIVETAKNKALQIINAYPLSTSFSIITNSSTEQNLSKEQAIQAISKVSISHRTKTTSQIYSYAQGISSADVFIISDMQQNMADLENILPDSLVSINFVPIKSLKTNNISIDSVWFATPYRTINQNEKLFVRIKNHGSQAEQQTVQLFINNSLKALGTINLEPNSHSDITLDYTINHTGNICGKVSIEDYPILYDNTYFFSYSISEKISALEIFANKTNNKLKNLLEFDSFISLTQQSISNVDYTNLHSHDVILLNALTEIPSSVAHQLQAFMENGKTVVIIPAEQINYNSYNDFLSLFTHQQFTTTNNYFTEVLEVDFKHNLINPLFKKIEENIALPSFKQHHQLSPNIISAEIMSFNNKSPFLMEYEHKKGKLYLFTADFSSKNTDFTSSPLFVSIYNMALFVKNTNALQTQLGKPAVISNNNYSQLSIANSEFNIDFIPQTQQNNSNSLALFDNDLAINKAGIYNVLNNKTQVASIAYNYNRSESQMEFKSNDQIQEEIQKFGVPNAKIYSWNTANLTHNISAHEMGTQLWRLALILSILFIFVEIVFIRFL